MKEMKLIMEGWRKYVNEGDKPSLLEISDNDPLTYELLKGILKLMVGAKQGLTGDALANASGLSSFAGSSEAAKLITVVTDMFAESVQQPTPNKQLLNEEIVTLGILLSALTYIGAVKTGANLIALGTKLYKKFKGEPTEKTDKVPFLDLFNLDPNYADIVDDRVEEAFLEWWLKDMEQKTGVVDSDDLDVNAKFIEYIDKEHERQLSGHTAPSMAGATHGMGKDIKRKIRMKNLARAAGKQG